ncbi:MAG: cation diffusion facilitator family transporter [Myxococcota bacterium]|nr:cation diffusion facilitator family transporter [Myxococcota bacterium]
MGAEVATNPQGNEVRGPARISLAVAGIILGLKLGAWWLTDSIALFADAMESVVNVLAAAGMVIALSVARQPPDQEHPFGHGKAEYFSAGFEGALIVIAAAGITWQAIVRYLDPTELHNLEQGFALATVATVGNGLLGLWLIRKGREHRSPALIADGKHLWTDVVTTVGALAGLGLAWATGWWVLDPIFGVLVAVNVLLVGVQVVRSSVDGLMDSALPPDELARLEGVIHDNMEGAMEAHDIRSRQVADRCFVDFHLVVPGVMTVAESHSICDRIEQALEAAFPGLQATIHVEPEDHAHGPLDS